MKHRPRLRVSGLYPHALLPEDILHVFGWTKPCTSPSRSRSPCPGPSYAVVRVYRVHGLKFPKTLESRRAPTPEAWPPAQTSSSLRSPRSIYLPPRHRGRLRRQIIILWNNSLSSARRPSVGSRLVAQAYRVPVGPARTSSRWCEGLGPKALRSHISCTCSVL